MPGAAMISQRAKYALKALVALARVESSAIIGDIARQHRIPHKFLEQILLDLKREGLVQSRRGRSGGYALLRPADQITFGEVLRIVDGPIAPLPCLSRTAYSRCADCHSERSCEVRRVFFDVAASARLVLDQMTIADAIAGKPVNGTDGGYAVRVKNARQVTPIARK
jgi:Rrf2 family protein